MKFDVFYLLKIMKITLLNIKIKEYTLNMIFNCSCDRKLRCIKNWNAQWEIWLVHSHENLIFTFVLLLTFKMVPRGHFCIFLTGLKTIMLTKGPLRGGLQKFEGFEGLLADLLSFVHYNWNTMTILYV